METRRSAALLRMARSISARRADGVEEGAEGGFTLIELMVVLLIMAILLAIAIPTFLGVKSGAQNRAVQSDLTNAITSAKAVYTNVGSYGTQAQLASLVTTLHSSEPELTFTTAAVSTGSHSISVYVSNDGLILLLAGQAANNTCWYAEDNEESTAVNGGVTGATSTQGISYSSSVGATAANCTAPNGTALIWTTSYPPS
jgi:type IV pilus assembly protein PilA